MRDLLAPFVLLVVLLLGLGWWIVAKLIIGEPVFRRRRKIWVVELKERPPDIVSLPPTGAIRDGRKLGIDA